jgi:hypothetical protein
MPSNVFRVRDTGSKEKRQNPQRSPIRSVNPICVTRTGKFPIPDDILVKSIVVSPLLQLKSRELKQ